jgi:putative hydrolase of the HAD superfamily
MLAPLRHIDCWIFDLDNSLYPASANLFALIDVRMSLYIQQLVGCGHDEARRLQKTYFQRHGTTLAGLMAAHGVDPHHFLDFVHDVDLARITADPVLLSALDRLPGRKMHSTGCTTSTR